MYWINFRTWNTGAGPVFKKQRIYLQTYGPDRIHKWTPFIRLKKRYTGKMFWDNLLWGIGLKKAIE